MSTHQPAYYIDPLAKHHNRENFSCGADALDQYFHQRAGQEVKKHIAATFVLVDSSNQSIAGYYTLSSLGINAGELPPEITKKLPKYTLLPATLLGRLAVDKQYRKKGLGELLLIDALRRSLNSSKEIASMALIVEAKDDIAITFYKRYGFLQFPRHSHKLFLPMGTIEKFLNTDLP